MDGRVWKWGTSNAVRPTDSTPSPHTHIFVCSLFFFSLLVMPLFDGYGNKNMCSNMYIYRKDGVNIRSTPASEKGGLGVYRRPHPKTKKCVSVCLYDLRVAHVRELRTPIYTPSSQLDITSSTHYRLLFFFFFPPFFASVSNIHRQTSQ